MLIKVAGGTGAGRRHVKTREPWACICKFHPGHVYSCTGCGARRPA